LPPDGIVNSVLPGKPLPSLVPVKINVLESGNEADPLGKRPPLFVKVKLAGE